MIKNNLARSIIILALLTLTISCDQVSKGLIRRKVLHDQSIQVIGHYVTITKVENSGSILGLGNSLRNPYRFILLTLIPILLLAAGGVFLFLAAHLSEIHVLGFTLILGGGIGNVYDRAVFGSVTDFLHIRVGPLQTGVFNVADMAIMTGIFILVLHSYIRQARMHKPNQ